MAYKRRKRFAAKRMLKVRFYPSRRYYRRRRRNRKRHYKSRRFPKRTEVKVKSGSQDYIWQFNTSNVSNNGAKFYPGRVFYIPAISSAHSKCCLNIEQGTTVNTRIGSKIKPVKLRLCGSISYEPIFQKLFQHDLVQEPAGITGYYTVSGQSSTDHDVPHSFQLRLFVYQLRGGNAFDKTESVSNNFHSLMIVPNANSEQLDESQSLIDGIGVSKLIGEYHGTHDFDVVQMRQNIGTGKTPLRLGIGGQMRMLYTKTFTVQTGSRSSVPFRIVTRVPNRLVWPENFKGDMDVDSSTLCRNPICVVWVCVPQSYRPMGNISVHQSVQLFYTDS